jgi:hypothetical protein
VIGFIMLVHPKGQAFYDRWGYRFQGCDEAGTVFMGPASKFPSQSFDRASMPTLLLNLLWAALLIRVRGVV